MHCSNSSPKSYYTFKKNCTMCQKEAQNLLSTADGEYIIYADRGRVTNLRKHNEYEHSSEPTKKSTPSGQRLLKGYELVDLMELAKTNKLKKLEFTKTRSVRMTFNEEKKDGLLQNWPNKKAQQGPNKNNNPNHVGQCCCKNRSKANTSPNICGASLNVLKTYTSPIYVGHGPYPNESNARNGTSVCGASQNASNEDANSTHLWYSPFSNRSNSDSCTSVTNNDDACSTISLQWTCPSTQGEGTSNADYGYGNHYTPHMGTVGNR